MTGYVYENENKLPLTFERILEFLTAICVLILKW